MKNHICLGYYSLKKNIYIYIYIAYQVKNSSNIQVIFPCFTFTVMTKLQISEHCDELAEVEVGQE